MKNVPPQFSKVILYLFNRTTFIWIDYSQSLSHGRRIAYENAKEAQRTYHETNNTET